MEHICFCGCERDEHDEYGECVFCGDCDSFEEDVDATCELAAQNDDIDLYDGLEDES